jgi:hypothetical protein
MRVVNRVSEKILRFNSAARLYGEVTCRGFATRILIPNFRAFFRNATKRAYSANGRRQGERGKQNTDISAGASKVQHRGCRRDSNVFDSEARLGSPQSRGTRASRSEGMSSAPSALNSM